MLTLYFSKKRIALFPMILSGISFSFISCEKKQTNNVILNEKVEQIDNREVHTDSTVIGDKVYAVEVFGKDGEKFEGKVVFRGENAAGYIHKKDKERVFIDVKESMDGGFEAIDLEGNKYFLLLMR